MSSPVRSRSARTTFNTLVLPKGTNSDWTVRRSSSSRQASTLCGCLVLQGSSGERPKLAVTYNPANLGGFQLRVNRSLHWVDLRAETLKRRGLRSPWMKDVKTVTSRCTEPRRREFRGLRQKDQKSICVLWPKAESSVGNQPCLVCAARSPVIGRPPGSVTLRHLSDHLLQVPSIAEGIKGWMISRS